MAEYLGIKVISENYHLWIVRDTLDVALPPDWIILKVSSNPVSYVFLLYMQYKSFQACVYMYIQKHVK
jgi:nicotinamide riboside transporter PnuC